MAEGKQAGPGTKLPAKKGKAAQAEKPRQRPAPPIESIDDVIADLQKRLAQLSEAVDAQFASASSNSTELTQVFALYAETASRLGRLLRDRQALSGEAADALTSAVSQVLDELSAEWGVEL